MEPMSVGGSLPLRSFLKDYPLGPPDAAAFEDRRLGFCQIYARVALVGLTVGFVVFWPLDPWFLGGVGREGLAAMATFRIAVILSLVALFVTALFRPLATRPAVTIFGIAAVLCLHAGLFLGPLFDLGAGVVDLALLLPFGLTPLWVSLRERIGLTVLVSGLWSTTLIVCAEATPEQLLVHAVTLLALGVIAVLCGHAIWNRARQNQALAGALARAGDVLTERVDERRRALRSAYDQLTVQREDERARLGRELHDATGQTLTGLRLELGLARMLASEESRPHLDVVSGHLDALFEGVRAVLMQLRPTVLDDLGLPAAIDWLAFQQSRRVGVSVHREIDEAAADVDPQVAIGVFRAAERALELLADQRPASMTLVLSREPDHLKLDVCCEAPATPPSEDASRLFLTERARSLEAELSVEAPDAPLVASIGLEIPLSGQTS